RRTASRRWSGERRSGEPLSVAADLPVCRGAKAADPEGCRHRRTLHAPEWWDGAASPSGGAEPDPTASRTPDTHPPPRPPPPAAPADRRRELWRRGRRPHLAASVSQAGRPGPRDLLDVLRVDQQQRWQSGEPVATEVYLREHPPLAAEIDLAVALIHAEYRL